MVTAARRLIAIVGCTLLGLIGTPAAAKTDGQQRVVERARLALDSFLDDPNFEYMRVYVQNAYAVLIVPEMLKAGFFFGAEYGVGVLLVRDPQSGNWGQPAFYSLYGGMLAWQVMIAAMMVPTSLPLAHLFVAASRRQPRPGLVMGAFLGGYALIWSVFGLTVFLADMGVHQLADRSAFLGSHEALIAGGTLAVAGAFQFTPLKKRCLTECRHPAGFLAAHYERGVGGAFRLGRKHGTFCVGCCAGLMLVMFAAGIANLVWMATLTVLMAYEKNGHAGSRLVPAVGCALLLWAAAVLVAPSWLPPLFAGEL